MNANNSNQPPINPVNSMFSTKRQQHTSSTYANNSSGFGFNTFGQSSSMNINKPMNRKQLFSSLNSSGFGPQEQQMPNNAENREIILKKVKVTSLPKDYRIITKHIRTTDNFSEMENYIRFKYYDDYALETVSPNNMLLYDENDANKVLTITYDEFDKVYELYSWEKLDVNLICNWFYVILDSNFDCGDLAVGIQEDKYCFELKCDALAYVRKEKVYANNLKEIIIRNHVMFIPQSLKFKGIWIFLHGGMWRIIYFDQNLWDPERLIAAFVEDESC